MPLNLLPAITWPTGTGEFAGQHTGRAPGMPSHDKSPQWYLQSELVMILTAKGRPGHAPAPLAGLTVRAVPDNLRRRGSQGLYLLPQVQSISGLSTLRVTWTLRARLRERGTQPQHEDPQREHAIRIPSLPHHTYQIHVWIYIHKPLPTIPDKPVWTRS